MNRGLWVARKHDLCNLIKKVSDGHGGEDIEELREYCHVILEAYPGERIEEAIICFTDLAEQLMYVPHRTRK